MKNKKIVQEPITLSTCVTSAIVVPVTLDGKFNLPINKELSKVFLNIKKQYKRAVDLELLVLGKTYKVRVWDKEANYKDVIFLAIARKSTDKVQPMWVKSTLKHFVATHRSRAITGVTFPLEYMNLLKNDATQIFRLFKGELKDLIIKPDYLTKGIIWQ